MQIKIQVALEHGIMFIHDPNEEVEVPADTGAAPFTYSRNCICFWVTNWVDGDTYVTLTDEGFPANIAPSFSADIPTPSKIIALSDVPVNYYGMLRVRDAAATVKIWNYEEDDKAKTWVQISNLDVF